MKVLFDHGMPFALAHGGFQVQIEQTKLALEKLGVEVEWVRWWDEKQRGDLIHYFGSTDSSNLECARLLGIPTVMTTLFTAACNRRPNRLALQGCLVRSFMDLPFGQGFKKKLPWAAYHLVDCNVVGMEAERRVLELVHGVQPGRTAVVPLGLSDSFLQAGPGTRQDPRLICVGTITDRKNSIPLAELAKRAEVPILFVGKPYGEADPYWQKFAALIDHRWVHHHPHVADEKEMITLLHAARGAVVMSRYENWCLVAHEAAACGLPLLLPNQPWAHERFGDRATYFSSSPADSLREFYEDCPQRSAPGIHLHSWLEVGADLKTLYTRLLKTSR